VALAAPYRAEAVRRGGDTWAVGASRIEVVRLPPSTSGDAIEIAWDGAERSVRADGRTVLGGVPELERLAARRFGSWVVRARRLRETLWEVDVEAL
jgi:hypothetical protein